MKANRRWALIAVLALALVAPWSRAQSPDDPFSKSPRSRQQSHKLTRKVYPVTDLVATLEQGPAGAGAADLLVRAITSAVKPHSWGKKGGPGTIEYTADTRSLVVHQTSDAHGKVAAVLKALALIQPKQPVAQTASPALFSPPSPGNHKQYGHFVLDNVRINAMGVSCTIRRARFLYKGDGIDNGVAKCALTGGESEKKADVPKVLTDLLEKISGKPDERRASPPTACGPACVAPLSPPCPAPSLAGGSSATCSPGVSAAPPAKEEKPAKAARDEPKCDKTSKKTDATDEKEPDRPEW